MNEIIRHSFFMHRNNFGTTYHKLLDGTRRTINKSEFLLALQEIKAIASWLYKVNFICFSKELEDDIRLIADNVIPEKINIINADPNRYVFIDTLGADNRGETQQYIRALMDLNKEFIYIYINDNITNIPEILKELGNYKNAKIITFNKKEFNYIEKAKFIISAINKLAPKRVFLHLMPWDVVSLLAISRINGVEIYNINLTDHAFWLGASFIDYNIEFRKYGKGISLKERGLKESQIIYLPYYPIISKYTVFQGFKDIPKETTIILTGGHYYKMFDKDNLFFKIIDDILDLSQNVIVLIAGDGDRKEMHQHLSTIRNKNRVILIGNRTDIAEVFKHCDIYLGTFPMPGGLMTQYAATFSKPIIAFGKKDDNNCRIEEFTNQLFEGTHTIYDYKELIDYSRKLIEDKNFRKQEGIKAHKGVMTRAIFNNEFLNLVTSKKTNIEWPSEPNDDNKDIKTKEASLYNTGDIPLIDLIYDLGDAIPKYYPFFMKQYAYLKMASLIKKIF